MKKLTKIAALIAVGAMAAAALSLCGIIALNRKKK